MNAKLPRMMCAVFVVLMPVVWAKDEKPKPADLVAKGPRMALEGAWVLKLDDGSHRLKIIAGGKWVVTQSDPDTGKVLRTIASNRFVTGVSWVDGELWHGTWEEDQSDVRRIDLQTGEVMERIEMPQGVNVSGLESDGSDRFFCGSGSTNNKVRAIRRPKRARA